MKKNICFIIALVSIISQLYGQEIDWQIEYQAKVNGEITAAYSGGFDYATPVLVDIDADGDLDFFTGYGDDNGVCYIRNDGTKTKPVWVLVSRNIFDIYQAFTAPAFCDIDNDGDLDAFVGGWDGKINFIRNTGSASSPAWTLETVEFDSIDVGYHSAPAFCDMDDDGDYDLFIGTTEGNVQFYRNTGSNSSFVYTLENDHFAQGVPDVYCKPIFYDIDNDGDQDLLIGSKYYIYFYQNEGTATNGVWNLNSTHYKNIDTNSFAVLTFGDIDGDNDADMIIGESENGLSYYRNTGSSSLADWELLSQNYLTLDVKYPCYPAFTDIDNDGDFDMFLGSYFYGIYQCINAGNVNEPDWTFSGITLPDLSSIPAFCDIDGDGDQDMFLGSNSDGTLQFLENTGTPENAVWATPVTSYAGADVGDSYCAPTFTDIDRDSDFDMFLGSGEGNLYFYENTGNVNAPAWAAPVANYAAATELNTWRLMPAFCDIDKDGDQDLFLGGYHGSVFFYRNIGTPVSANFEFITSTYNNFTFEDQTRPAFCDIDGDGDADMFWGMTEGGLLYWRNGNPVGIEKNNSELPVSFELEQNYPNPFNPVTTIEFSLPHSEHVTMEIWNINGQKVTTLVNRQMAAGNHTVIWNAGQFPSGVYFCSLTSNHKTAQIIKLILLK